MPDIGTHGTGWEDQGMVSFYCGRTEAGMLSVDDGVIACPLCGKRIHLVWEVYVEEDPNA